MTFNTTTKIGILGGGQLGKMLIQAGSCYHLPIAVLAEASDFPAVPYATSFFQGSYKNYDEVYQFGKTVDVLTIEIEHVNTQALHDLVAEGVVVHPHPSKLDIIKDKGLQKQFYQQHGIPTPDFQLFESTAALQSAIASGKVQYPFVQKTRTAGYDGKGVAIINTATDQLLEGACLIESKVDMAMELAVIVARNADGMVVAYDPVEMVFNPVANLVELLACPARISATIAAQATTLAKQVIETFDICGLLAVEFFLTHTEELLVNEVAPRPHNSGHHTIDACVTSQFEQHLRAILNWPLGSTRLHTPTVMVNLLGSGSVGRTAYENIIPCLAMEGVHFHLYGKSQSTPYRKMGHATIVHPNLDEAIAVARAVQQTVKVVGQ